LCVPDAMFSKPRVQWHQRKLKIVDLHHCKPWKLMTRYGLYPVHLL
jgi:hypothetical protein